MSDKQLSWEASVRWLKTQPEQAELVRACFYDDPLIVAAKRYYESGEWQAVEALMPTKTGRALDIGAGRGIASYALARGGWEVVALEPDPSMEVGAGAIRNLAAETGLSIAVEENWGETLPFADESFDLIHARQVLHHAHDLDQLCREASRVLKKGGVFIATREHVISREEDLQAFLDSHPLHRLYGGEHAYTLGRYLAAIAQSGIKLEKVLNPFASDINLYPDTIDALKQRIADRLKLPSRLIPRALISLLGARNATPGRLYTFVGRKP